MKAQVNFDSLGGGAKVKFGHVTFQNSINLGFEPKTLTVMTYITAFTDRVRTYNYDGEKWYCTAGSTYTESQSTPSDIQLTSNGFTMAQSASIINDLVYMATDTVTD